MYRLRLSEGEIHLGVTEATEERSHSTGKTLRHLVADVRLARGPGGRDDGIAALEAALKGDDPVEVLDESNVATPFQVRRRQMSYRQGEAERHYVLELNEVEPTDCADLVIDGRSFGKPDRYSEKVDDVRTEQGDELRALIVHATVRLSDDDLDWVWNRKRSNEPRYFPVVRQGVSDEPRSMRFGRVIWDRHDDGLRAFLVLVEETYDRDPDHQGPALLERPEDSTVRRQFLDLQVEMDRLLELLVSKNVLTPDEVSLVKRPDEEARWQRRRSLYEVDDVDEWNS